MIRTLSALILLAATTAHANVQLEFREGAPKDRFVVSNIGTCDLKNVKVTIDLKNSAGKLIFDVTSTGAGVEVFQPFVIETGRNLLASRPVVVDGQTQVTFDLPSFDAGKKVIASTDVDDTIGQREITVKASEFAGTEISISVNNRTYSTQIKDKPEAIVKIDDC